MYNFIRNHQRLVQIFLALVTLPFLFSGVESWLNNVQHDEYAAKVGDQQIPKTLFLQELNQRLEQLRAAQGDAFNLSKADTPALRAEVMDQLVEKQLLLLDAKKQNFIVSVEAVREAIKKIPDFQESGVFSTKRYEEILKAIGKSAAQFEGEIRESVLLQQLVGGIEGSVLQSKAIADQIIAQQTEQREIAEHKILPDQFIAEAHVDDAAVRKYYDSHSKEFQQPEKIKVAYIMLSAATLAKNINLTDAELQAAYQANPSAYEIPEKRNASHILLVAATPADKEKIKAKAQELLAAVKKDPAAFAKIAKESSQDPGSAAKGGELGFFGRGDMVKSFEDAAFTLKVGDISNLVESDFGYHIIKLNAIQPKTVRPFDEVKGQIEADKRRELAERKFTELADEFEKVVYEQSDSLEHAATKFKLDIKTDDNWLEKGGHSNDPVLNNAELAKALFESGSTVKKQNTKAVEVAPKTLVSARITAHQPAAMQTFDQVKAAIMSKLQRQQALQLAQKKGEQILANLKGQNSAAAAAELNWSTPNKINRGGAAKEVSKLIFKIAPGKWPAYTGILSDDAYTVYKLISVSQPPLTDDQKKAIVGQLESIVQQESIRDYIATLKKRYGVTLNQSAIDNKKDAL